MRPIKGLGRDRGYGRRGDPASTIDEAKSGSAGGGGGLTYSTSTISAHRGGGRSGWRSWRMTEVDCFGGRSGRRLISGNLAGRQSINPRPGSASNLGISRHAEEVEAARGTWTVDLHHRRPAGQRSGSTTWPSSARRGEIVTLHAPRYSTHDWVMHYPKLVGEGAAAAPVGGCSRLNNAPAGAGGCVRAAELDRESSANV